MSMNQVNLGTDPREQVMTVKNWLITSLIMCIPLVNIIMLFVWAFGDGTNKNKANYAKAGLLLMLIVLVLYAVIAIIFFSVFANALKDASF
ncbi:hypothetical protein ABE504_02220 [Paenibacillus oryzisoli]|uniref:hypothetical protein n=1 Tax=Paenibacillus oryzisoli TaxID=1850517 RepID=UPI003D2DAA01